MSGFDVNPKCRNCNRPIRIDGFTTSYEFENGVGVARKDPKYVHIPQNDPGQMCGDEHPGFCAAI